LGCADYKWLIRASLRKAPHYGDHARQSVYNRKVPRPLYTWHLRSRELSLGERTLVMGILNVTPDSFSDAGKFLERDRAVAHALQMLDEGADIIDIGGESTRPGARVGESGVSAREELMRVLPAIEDVLRERPEAVISVDTYKAEVARAALHSGAEIINDVSAMRWDPEMRGALDESRCGLILMHSRGLPEQWKTQSPSPDIVKEVKDELGEWATSAVSSGISRERLVLDPGFGFGKRFDENMPLLAHLGELHDLGFPLLSGTSRKSFIGRTLLKEGKDAPAEKRLYGTLATVVASVLQGAHIVRVHDVRPALEAVKVADAVLAAANYGNEHE
jgi:dihydropteroate synthase